MLHMIQIHILMTRRPTSSVFSLGTSNDLNKDDDKIIYTFGQE